ncbi:MAG: DUF3429 domain-containing protein [Inhella sp.]
MSRPGAAEPSALASRLGYAGLLPFVGGAALAWLLARPDYLAEHAFVMQGLSAYAATVIAFLGALHWGLVMRQPEPGALRWGVWPALLAWVGLLMPAYAGLVVHGVLLLACYAVDRRSYPRLGVGGWLTLRFRCTVLASLCCFLAAAAT